MVVGVMMSLISWIFKFIRGRVTPVLKVNVKNLSARSVEKINVESEGWKMLQLFNISPGGSKEGNAEKAVESQTPQNNALVVKVSGGFVGGEPFAGSLICSVGDNLVVVIEKDGKVSLSQ
jgi:hypothetical protein